MEGTMNKSEPFASLPARSDYHVGEMVRLSRRSLLAAPIVLLVACIAEPVAGPNDRDAESKLPSFAGTMSAAVSLTRADGVRKTYQSGKIPYRTNVEAGRVVIAAPYIRDLGKSMIEVPSIGRIAPRTFLAVTELPTALSFLASTGDPEADLDAFAQANPTGQQSEDVYLTSAEWSMLTSEAYDEQISANGTMAHVAIDPISQTNPYGQVRLYLNGILVVTVNPQYEPASGGYHDHTNGEATYGYYTGSQTSSGTRTTQGEVQDPLNWRPDQDSELGRLYRPQFATLLNAFLPKAAYAQQQENCLYYMRGALISLAGMYFAGRSGNVMGFITSWIGVINSVHQFARCKERNRL